MMFRPGFSKPLLLPLLFCAVSFLLFTACESSGPDPKALSRQADDINRQCPKMIDSETQLQKVALKEPSTLSYSFCLVQLNRQNVDTHEFRLNLWPGLLSGIKLDPNLKELREQDIRFEYHYLDRANQLIYTFRIGPEHYKL